MAAFHFRFVALAVDAIDRHGSSNEICHQLKPKKTKVRLVIAVYIAAKDNLTRPSLLTRWNALFLKVGVSYGW